MPLLFEDELYSGTASSPDGLSTVMLPPPRSGGIDLTAPGQDAGIGIAPTAEQPAAPVEARAPKLNKLGLREEAIANMTGGQKFLAALGEFGAAVQGKASPLDTRIKQQREEKLLQTQELKAHVDALESGAKIAKTLTGEARTNFVRDYMAQLEGMRPGLGDSFKHIADQPDLLSQFQAYLPHLSEEAKLLLKTNPDGFIKWFASDGGQKEIREARDRQYSALATRKAQGFIGNLQQLGLDQQLTADFLKQPSASLFLKLQDALPDGHPYKLSPEQRQAAEAKADLFYQSLGMLSPKDEAAVKVEKAKAKPETTVTEIGVSGGKHQKANVTVGTDDKVTVELIGEPYEKKDGTSITVGAPVAGVDENGNPVFFQPSRQGGKPTVVPGVTPPPKGGPVQAAIAEAIAKAGGGKAAAKKSSGNASIDAAKAGEKPAPALPAEIVAKLKAGVNTTLSDDSVWTLEGGKPKKVR